MQITAAQAAESYIIEGIKNRDLSKVPLDPNVVFQGPLHEKPIQGIQALRDYLEGFYPIIKDVRIKKSVANKNEACVLWELELTEPPAVIPVFEYFRTADGRLVEIRPFYDPRAVTNPPSLYERSGGFIKIAEIVDDLVERVKKDPIIQANPAIVEGQQRLPKPATKFQVTLMVCEVTGGPYKYVGRDLKESHKHLNISPKEWEAFVADTAASLDACNVPEREKSELLTIVENTREDCVADVYLDEPKGGANL